MLRFFLFSHLLFSLGCSSGLVHFLFLCLVAGVLWLLGLFWLWVLYYFLDYFLDNFLDYFFGPCVVWRVISGYRFDTRICGVYLFLVLCGRYVGCRICVLCCCLMCLCCVLIFWGGVLTSGIFSWWGYRGPGSAVGSFVGRSWSVLCSSWGCPGSWSATGSFGWGSGSAAVSSGVICVVFR